MFLSAKKKTKTSKQNNKKKKSKPENKTKGKGLISSFDILDFYVVLILSLFSLHSLLIYTQIILWKVSIFFYI